jgi:hypothetical protein
MPAGLRDFMVVFESTNGMPPTPAQVALLMNFLSNKDQFFESAVRRLVSDGTTDNARGLEVYSVTVPSDPARAPGCFVLELCYPDAEQIFVVDFRDNQPTGSTYDD